MLNMKMRMRRTDARGLPPNCCSLRPSTSPSTSTLEGLWVCPSSTSLLYIYAFFSFFFFLINKYIYLYILDYVLAQLNSHQVSWDPRERLNKSDLFCFTVWLWISTTLHQVFSNAVDFSNPVFKTLNKALLGVIYRNNILKVNRLCYLGFNTTDPVFPPSKVTHNHFLLQHYIDAIRLMLTSSLSRKIRVIRKKQNFSLGWSNQILIFRDLLSFICLIHFSCYQAAAEEKSAFTYQLWPLVRCWKHVCDLWGDCIGVFTAVSPDNDVAHRLFLVTVVNLIYIIYLKAV